MEESIFTKIIKGEVPCFKIYEDQRTFAFLDIHPIQPGQVLVVPKKQVASLWQLDNEDYMAVMMSAKLVAHKLSAVFDDHKLIGMQVEGLDVPHAHVKLFPFKTSKEFHNIPGVQDRTDNETLSQMAKKLEII